MRSREGESTTFEVEGGRECDLIETRSTVESFAWSSVVFGGGPSANGLGSRRWISRWYDGYVMLRSAIVQLPLHFATLKVQPCIERFERPTVDPDTSTQKSLTRSDSRSPGGAESGIQTYLKWRSPITTAMPNVNNQKEGADCITMVRFS